MVELGNTTIKRIGLLTSGGDAPGMNGAIRAVTRAARYKGLEVIGISHGYKGLINKAFKKMESKDVSNILQQGGTMLKSARCMEFKTPEGRKKAHDNIVEAKIDALVVIGGDGTFTGAGLFAKEFNFPVVGIPGTIDNDLYGTDFTIGYDTALNTIVECVDKIKDTATAHERLFFIEVMGRDAGFLALNGGIAAGSEAVLIPEVPTSYADLKSYLANGYRKSKNSSIVLVAEGEKEGGAFNWAKRVEKDFPDYDVRVTILGHIQRGGTPSASDRILASRLGAGAVEALMDDQKSIMIGIENGEIVHVPFTKAIKNQKVVERQQLDLVKILSN
ncbi:6-phosphofructokinase [Halosquirtibacter xylanolyticus]|uniref:6-phosphofructokinase n=1 Tax=Halosquirtibacter xylanolyticus TaxID=3374599 RepID=UPI00374A0082|nr:6-phosphofructokinase [Prolixibacteraceae bacterium]